MQITDQNPINTEIINNASAFHDSLQYMQEIAAGHGPPGTDKPGDYKHLIKLNYQRMKRVYKTCELSGELKEVAGSLSVLLIWMVLTDIRCADSTYSIPVMQRIAESGSHIELKILYRDEHPEIMDAFLTNGARAVPKLICLDARSLKVLDTWGPRPEPMQKLLEKHKKNPVLSKDEFSELIQRKYLEDKTGTIQNELLNLLRSIHKQ